MISPCSVPSKGRMTERTIPILPCKSIEETLAFYRALGFAVTFQQRPNPYAVVERAGITLHLFAIKAYDPAQSYSTCYITTTDVDGLYDAFRTRLRAALGRLPTRGLPRIGPRPTTATPGRWPPPGVGRHSLRIRHTSFGVSLA
jgi:hypothetical protein